MKHITAAIPISQNGAWNVEPFLSGRLLFTIKKQRIRSRHRYMIENCDLVPAEEKCVGKCDWWIHDMDEIVCCRSLMHTQRFAETLVRLSGETANE